MSYDNYYSMDNMTTIIPSLTVAGGEHTTTLYIKNGCGCISIKKRVDGALAGINQVVHIPILVCQDDSQTNVQNLEVLHTPTVLTSITPISGTGYVGLSVLFTDTLKIDLKIYSPSGNIKMTNTTLLGNTIYDLTLAIHGITLVQSDS